MQEQGIILINKEKDITSRDVINKLNRILGTKKIGHTGTLDPMATGLLVVCVGRYTKLVDHISLVKKEYIAKIKLGIKTDTLDITGNVLDKGDRSVDKKSVIMVLNSMLGTFHQKIPAYSAKKINGKKLYEYARNNEKVEDIYNDVEIYNIELLSFENDEIEFKTTVSKGTYIRSLIEEICNRLDVFGTMSSLTRTMQGELHLEDSYTIEEIKDNNFVYLKAKDILDYEQIEIDDDTLKKVLNGNKISIKTNGERVILTNKNKEIAIYKKDNNIYRLDVLLNQN